MKSSHRPATRFVIRTPVLPFDVLGGLSGLDVAGVRSALRKLLEDPGVNEAIFVASPDLSEQVVAWQRADGDGDPAVARTIVRYISRMAGRATPFGLFSGVAIGTAGEATRLELGPRSQHQRHTRLDNDYLFKLCDQLRVDPTIRGELSFVPNSSLYRSGDRYRYAEATPADSGRVYQLIAVETTPYIEAILERASSGATLSELGDVLAGDPELTRLEIDAFIDELVTAQVLVPALQPRVTGTEPAHVMIDMLRAIPSGRTIAQVLADVTKQIATIDDTRAAPPEVYRSIAKTLGALPVEVDLTRLFQVDLNLSSEALTLGPRVMAEIARAGELVRTLAPPPAEDPWARFRDAFITRYETREVPLVEVLDEESGIGFGGPAEDTAQAPLVADLPFPGRPETKQVTWSARDAHLLRLHDRAIATGALELELDAADLEALTSDPIKLPDTTSMMVTVMAASAEAADAGEFELRVQGIGGSSATRMLGRFCHGSADIASLVNELVEIEHAGGRDAVFAEIVHLPEGRLGNILLRPVLREYEIQYLGTSGAAEDRQLPVTDLMVSVVGSRVVLRSKRLGKEIRPQLATAHNFGARSLVIYRFLCGHAMQGLRGASWSWGILSDAGFLPRIRHGRVILARARWLLLKPDLEILERAAKGAKAAKTPAQLAELHAREVAAGRALRDRRKLPRWVLLADGDNELPIDFENPISVESFVNVVKGRASAELFELLPSPDQLVVRGPGGGYVHEMLIPFVRADAAPPPTVEPRITSTVIRRFAPGSAWLYAKLYGGTAAAESVLRDYVIPLVAEARERGLADRFFFIRYSDPDHHLRLRWFGDPGRLTGELLPRLAQQIAPAIEDGSVWRFQLDTYEREIERYGGDHIELAEALFAADSTAALAIIDATPGDEGARARWRLVLRGIDTLLADLGLSLAERLASMTTARDNFGAEFGMDTAFQRRLGDKFRTHRTEIAELLAAPADDPEHIYGPALEALAKRSQELAPIALAFQQARAAGTLGSPITDLAGSFVHMHVNRMLASAQRRQEVVLYDLLRRHYDGVLARERGAARKADDQLRTTS